MQLVAFALGNGPSNDDVCRAGGSVPRSTIVPLHNSHGDAGDCCALGEPCRVMAASVIWTRGCKDQLGAQIDYFTSLHSPQKHQ